MTTIRELARRSGVSIATVSRALNGYPDVSDATRERVVALAKELDYQPTAAARTLATNRSWLVGVVLHTGFAHPDVTHPFFSDVLDGLKHRVGELGYDLLLFATEESARGSKSYLRRTQHHRVDGLVLMGVDEHDPEIQRLAQSSVACVGIDQARITPRTGFVISDNRQGVRLALDHLAKLGHTRIATIAGETSSRAGAERLTAYRERLTELGLPYVASYVREGDFYFDSGYARMRELLGLPEPPTAVLAASDMMAIGAARALDERGLRPGRDIALVGFDDIALAGLVSPALTTIRQDPRRVGAVAGESLVRMIDDPQADPPCETLPVELVVRESCGAVAYRDLLQRNGR
jgi:LacI family transcriptional regulator